VIWPKELVGLAAVLAGLYPTESSARALVRKAQLDEAKIAFHPESYLTWQAIIEHAWTQGALAGLYDTVLAPDEFAGNPALQTAVVAAKSAVIPPAPPAPPSPPAPAEGGNTVAVAAAVAALLAALAAMQVAKSTGGAGAAGAATSGGDKDPVGISSSAPHDAPIVGGPAVPPIKPPSSSTSSGAAAHPHCHMDPDLGKVCP
jgi:hypothetical protein